ncbi:MAG: hypothetical protein ACR2K1_00180 [Saprospiraceae bacterium]
MALFAFAVAELTGAEARRVLAGIEQSELTWEYADEGGVDDEIAEDGTLESGGSDDAPEGTAPGEWRTDAPAALCPGHSAWIRPRFTAAAACAAHANARLLKRVRPPLFILYCHFSGALPEITI